MKKIFLSIVAVLLCELLYAAPDNQVIGNIKTKSSGLPIEFATVSLHDANAHTVLTGATTDSIGKFLIENVPAGYYYIESSSIGYKTIQSQPFHINTSKTTDIGTMLMDDNVKEIGEVIVEGRKSTFVGKLDRKVFNVGQDLMSSAGSAADLMQNIPSVEVDMDGTVSLRGNENVTILINGKPSAMMSAKTRGDALNQLSANSIERIEAISNPSVAFKPDGVSGIINIVLKKDAKEGVNGTVTANAGSYGRSNAGINLNYGMKHIKLFSGYAFRHDRYDRSITDKRVSQTDSINQNTIGIGRPISHTVSMGMNMDLGKHDAIEIAGNYNHRKLKRDENLESLTKDLNSNITEHYLRNRAALANENMWEGSFHYTHTYGKDNDLNVDYTYSSETEDEMNNYSTNSINSYTKDNEQVWDANYLHIGKVYWQQRVSERLKLSSGYELEHSKAEQNFHVQDWDGTNFITNKEKTNDFTHYMMLHSLYATIEIKAGKWNFLAGLRGELANIKNHLFSIDSIATQHYFNIYPTIHTSRQIDSHNELQLNYSLRINRPEGADMNPFAERINPLSLKSGNPDLKPEKIHSIEAGWLWHNDNGTSLMTTLYYRYLTNQITEVSRYIDNGVLLTTKENLQTSQNAGAELIWNYPMCRWLNFNWNVNGYYNQINAEKLGFGKNKDTFSWSTLLNANFTPFHHYMVQLNARYRSSTLVPQGRRDADCRINLGMKYDIPSINLSVMASVTDLFDTYRKSYTLNTPELQQKVVRRRNPRIFYMGLSYQLGQNKNKKHNTKLEYDENM